MRTGHGVCHAPCPPPRRPHERRRRHRRERRHRRRDRRRLAREGFDVVAGARRADRLEQLVAELGPPARAHALDVTDQASVDAFAAQVESCAVLVCNAGGALGLDPLPDITDEQWRAMWEVNVLGVVRTVRALLPALRASGDGRIVVVTSIAGHEVYANGAGYTSAKHAAAAVTDTLRLELLAEPIRVIEIARAWWRPSSPPCASAATRRRRPRSTRASSRSPATTSRTPSRTPSRARRMSPWRACTSSRAARAAPPTSRGGILT